MTSDAVELSFVIPVYNGSHTVADVVERIHECFRDLAIQVVLVNDGSEDDSEATCMALAASHPATVCFVHLARNFGEHNAVMAGLNVAAGRYVAVLDDDGQNPPEEVQKLYAEIRKGENDAVYGHYRVKRHGWFRNLGSRFNDRVANFLLDKPPELYLSSFKVMNRFLVDEIVRYRGAFPYIDGLVLRATSRVTQVEVEHREREHADSNYTVAKLFWLWLNMFLNFSIAPLRISVVAGLLTAATSLLGMVAVVIDKLYINPEVTIGLPTVLLVVMFFAGVQLLILGVVGEYLGRVFLDRSGHPQYVVRYQVEQGQPRD
ncbi:MAG: glycosyltransferase family 2 protein [Myxococcota bacterium]|nr:glycosyltransferase family 2 protein [Myxococcota bacterium]